MAPRGRGRPDASREPEQVLYAPHAGGPGETARIEGGEVDHLRRSLRLHSGDPVVLVDGRGHRYRGVVVDIRRSRVDVAVERREALPVWPRRRIRLGAGVLRSTRMDFLVEKASELGVERLTPLLLDRCVARPREEGTKLDRWERIAVESLKQSKRSRLMALGAPTGLRDYLDESAEGVLWAADPAGDPPERAPDPGGAPLGLLVGPEGGLSGAERALLEARGAAFVRLGGNRLRAETAALTLVTAALAVLGELGQETRLTPPPP